MPVIINNINIHVKGSNNNQLPSQRRMEFKMKMSKGESDFTVNGQELSLWDQND